MATIKSYSDLQQSKKLAEFLPLESADMWWLYVTAQGKHIAMMYEEPDPHYLARMESYGIKDAAIRCWSLAALLDILKDKFTFGGASDKDWFLAYTVKTPRELLTIYESNLVDACVAMIEKLHELKML